MKCSELLRLIKRNGWMEISQRGSHIKLILPGYPERGVIVFPNHGSAELGKGLETKLKRQAGIK